MAQAHHPLLEVLRGRNTALATHAQNLIREAHRVVDFTLSTFPSGTDHTAKHTTMVECIGKMLLPDAFLGLMSDEELFFLVTACHYHDLAMAGTAADDATAETRDQVRRDHAIRIGQRIAAEWRNLGFENERYAHVLGEVCRGHRPEKNADGEAHWNELNAVEVLAPGATVRLRLVSALIYAIDELHLGSDRAPARVEDWREIREEESRRHWRRHQAINGPALLPTGSLVFQVKTDTPGFEENLRSQVFRKAFSAVKDLVREARENGITVALPALEVQWDRQTLWQLLMPIACSDLRPRTRQEIEESVIEGFNVHVASNSTLSEFCLERGILPEEVLASVQRSVRDALIYRHFISSPENALCYILSNDERIADLLFTRMRSADEIDRLYLGRYCLSWEERLFESPYGRVYVTQCVLPAVDRSYSVNLAQRPANDAIRIVLERCPTATRLTRDFRPPPSNLVKDALLRQAVITGALFDLHEDPNRILDVELRAAVRSLSASDSMALQNIRLIEELALVSGFTPAQLSAAHDISDAAREILELETNAAPAGFNVTINQKIPAGAPAVTSQLPNLLLASIRSNIPIMLAAAPDHGLNININELTPGMHPFPDQQPTMIGIGPGVPRHVGPRHLPARFQLSRNTRTLRLFIGRFDSIGNSQYPLIVCLPPPPSCSVGETVSITFTFLTQWPKLTIRDLRGLEAAQRMFRNDRASIELVLEENGAIFGSMISNSPSELCDLGIWNSDSIRALTHLDGELPVPLFVHPNQIIACSRMLADQRRAFWESLRGSAASTTLPRRIPCAVYLRLANTNGSVIEESFIRFFPDNLFSSPQINDGQHIQQAEVNAQWASGAVEFKMTSFFQQDVFELSRSLREWCQDPSTEFPFNFSFGPTSVRTPGTRTALTILFPIAENKIWHHQRAVIFEFRPISQAEAYELEAIYWRSCGQDARAALADEIRARVPTPNAVTTNGVNFLPR